MGNSDTWAQVLENADALKKHWNETKRQKANPGDRLLGCTIASLLEAIEAHDTKILIEGGK